MTTFSERITQAVEKAIREKNGLRRRRHCGVFMARESEDRVSCDWMLHCVTCDDTERGLEINHGEEQIAALIANRDMMERLDALQLFRFDFELTRFGQSLPLGFFTTHKGHVLRPMNEYGQLSGDCNKRNPCACGHQWCCKMPDGHSGECKPQGEKARA